MSAHVEVAVAGVAAANSQLAATMVMTVAKTAVIAAVRRDLPFMSDPRIFCSTTSLDSINNLLSTSIGH